MSVLIKKSLAIPIPREWFQKFSFELPKDPRLGQCWPSGRKVRSEQIEFDLFELTDLQKASMLQRCEEANTASLPSPKKSNCRTDKFQTVQDLRLLYSGLQLLQAHDAARSEIAPSFQILSGSLTASSRYV